MTDQPQLWTTQLQSESQEINPIPRAEDGTPPDEWLGGVHPDGQLEVTSGFYLHSDKFSRVLSYLARERQPEGSVYKQLMRATRMSNTQVQAFVQYGVNMELLVQRCVNSYRFWTAHVTLPLGSPPGKPKAKGLVLGL